MFNVSIVNYKQTDDIILLSITDIYRDLSCAKHHLLRKFSGRIYSFPCYSKWQDLQLTMLQ